ncbi:TPA: hypothetical protein ACH3X3_010834 [Trebouxia sp. C0006]
MCSSNATSELSMHVLWRHNFLQHHTCFSVTHYVDVGKGKSSQSEQHGYKVQTTEQLVHTTKILRTAPIAENTFDYCRTWQALISLKAELNHFTRVRQQSTQFQRGPSII